LVSKIIDIISAAKFNSAIKAFYWHHIFVSKRQKVYTIFNKLFISSLIWLLTWVASIGYSAREGIDDQKFARFQQLM
jgi:hypothetical protein